MIYIKVFASELLYNSISIHAYTVEKQEQGIMVLKSISKAMQTEVYQMIETAFVSQGLKAA